MRFYIIAGEASGDMHGASLIRSLKAQQPHCDCRVWGGDKMEAAGGILVKHFKDLAFMGFVEVAKNIRTILRNLKFCKSDIKQWKPDALILIDYPGFNLRIAKWAHKAGIPVLYYISPQIWAWHQSRVKGIKRTVDQMFVILPFEQAFYKSYGMDVEYVGHPLIDEIDSYLSQKPGSVKTTSTIAILPGSRRQEIKHILPEVSQIFPNFPDLHFIIAATPQIQIDFYEKYLETTAGNYSIVQGKTYDLLQQANAAITASGTATLETALFRVPQLVCYKGNALSYAIARRLVKVPYISLVNLIADRPLIHELIQKDLNQEKLTSAFQELLNPVKREHMINGYQEIREKLGNSGAADRTAQLIFDYVNSTKSTI